MESSAHRPATHPLPPLLKQTQKHERPQDAAGNYVAEGAPGATPVKLSEAEVEKRGDGHVLKARPDVRVGARAHKMSKSRGNVVNPDDVVYQFGADSLRLYEMFMGPLRETKARPRAAVHARDEAAERGGDGGREGARLRRSEGRGKGELTPPRRRPPTTPATATAAPGEGR